MILLIAGASHSGKTLLAQKLLEKYKMPYLSIDHLKMGLIRSGQTKLTPEDDELLTGYLWPIIREMIKTAVENGQNLIVEGVYIPFGWEQDFEEKYRKEIQYFCLVMAEEYIRKNFSRVHEYASVIENRGDDSWYTMEDALLENQRNLHQCREYGYPYLLIQDTYTVDLVLENGCFRVPGQI